MKRSLTIFVCAAVLFGLTSVTPAHAGCISTGGSCPDRPGGSRGEPGFGGTGGGGSGRPAISIKNVSKPEGSSEIEMTSFKLTVSLSHASNGVVKVDYATSPGSASSGEDYIDESGTVSFPAGTTTKKISVDVWADFNPEDDEQFFVGLSNAKGGKIKDGSGKATIVDDDGEIGL